MLNPISNLTNFILLQWIGNVVDVYQYLNIVACKKCNNYHNTTAFSECIQTLIVKHCQNKWSKVKTN